MARARNIKPGFFKNEDLASIDPHARLLFIGLWTHADKHGRFEVRVEKIKAEIFPYEQVMLESCLAQLWDKHFLTFYEADNKRFGQINNWKRHQTPHHKEVESGIPACKSEKVFTNQDDLHAWLKHGSSITRSRFKQVASCPTDSLNRIPDTGFLDSDVDESSSPVGEDNEQDDPSQVPVDETPSTKKPPAGEPRFIAKHAELPPGVDPANWQRWCEYRSSKRKPISRHAARQQVALLAEQPPDVQRAMVQQSIQNDYQGLFVPRGASHAAGQPGRKPVSEIDRVNEAISRRAQEREAVLSGQWPASDGRGDFLETDVGVVRLPVHATVRR